MDLLTHILHAKHIHVYMRIYLRMRVHAFLKELRRKTERNGAGEGRGSVSEGARTGRGREKERERDRERHRHTGNKQTRKAREGGIGQAKWRVRER